MNPFKSELGNVGYTPVNPTINESHEDCYIPIDHTQEKYEDYQFYLNSLNGVLSNQATIIYGPSGCGKTSLKYRLLFSLLKRKWNDAKTNNLKPYILDLNDENLRGKSAKEKVTDIIYFILDKLEEEKISDDLITKFKEKMDSGPSQVLLRFFALKLKSAGYFLIIIFPEIDSIAEIKEYMPLFYRGNWALFFECNNIDVFKYCQRQHTFEGSSRPIKTFELTPLKIEDGDLFVAKKIALVQESIVKFKLGILKNYLKKRGQKRKITKGVSIRELERICASIYQKAIEEGITEITSSFFFENVICELDY